MAKEHVLMTSFLGNPNVGLYAYASDNICLVGYMVPQKLHAKISEILKVPVRQTNLAGTSMMGVFCAGNSHSLLLPEIVFDDELKALDRHGVKYSIVNTNLTALGNNILCNDHGAIVSPDFEEKAIRQIEQALKVKVERGTIAGLDIVGSLASVTNTRGLISIDATDEEVALIEKTLKVKLTRGTMGMGVPYISSSIVLNSNGFIVSDHSSGIEIADADEALGYMD